MHDERAKHLWGIVLLGTIAVAMSLVGYSCVGVTMWYPKGKSQVQIDAPGYGHVHLTHDGTTSETAHSAVP